MALLLPEDVLPREFYERDPEIVAKELLGKKIVRKLNEDVLEGIIVETEAYYGLGRMHFRKKNWNEARLFFKKHIDLGGKYQEDAKRLLKSFEFKKENL